MAVPNLKQFKLLFDIFAENKRQLVQRKVVPQVQLQA